MGENVPENIFASGKEMNPDFSRNPEVKSPSTEDTQEYATEEATNEVFSRSESADHSPKHPLRKIPRFSDKSSLIPFSSDNTIQNETQDFRRKDNPFKSEPNQHSSRNSFTTKLGDAQRTDFIAIDKSTLAPNPNRSSSFRNKTVDVQLKNNITEDRSKSALNSNSQSNTLKNETEDIKVNHQLKSEQNPYFSEKSSRKKSEDVRRNDFAAKNQSKSVPNQHSKSNTLRSKTKDLQLKDGAIKLTKDQSKASSNYDSTEENSYPVRDIVNEGQNTTSDEETFTTALTHFFKSGKHDRSPKSSCPFRGSLWRKTWEVCVSKSPVRSPYDTSPSLQPPPKKVFPLRPVLCPTFQRPSSESSSDSEDIPSPVTDRVLAGHQRYYADHHPRLNPSVEDSDDEAPPSETNQPRSDQRHRRVFDSSYGYSSNNSTNDGGPKPYHRKNRLFSGAAYEPFSSESTTITDEYPSPGHLQHQRSNMQEPTLHSPFKGDSSSDLRRKEDGSNYSDLLCNCCPSSLDDTLSTSVCRRRWTVEMGSNRNYIRALVNHDDVRSDCKRSSISPRWTVHYDNVNFIRSFMRPGALHKDRLHRRQLAVN